MPQVETARRSSLSAFQYTNRSSHNQSSAAMNALTAALVSPKEFV
jgi:hypothetical protein